MGRSLVLAYLANITSLHTATMWPTAADAATLLIAAVARLLEQLAVAAQAARRSATRDHPTTITRYTPIEQQRGDTRRICIDRELERRPFFGQSGEARPAHDAGAVVNRSVPQFWG